MATKKAADKPAEQPADQPRDTATALNDMGTSETSGKNIDERMAALLKDHRKMGVR